MTTLDNWKHLARPMNWAISFEEARLFGRDGDQHDIINGNAEILMPTHFETNFVLEGVSPDIRHTLRAITSLEEDTYDGLSRPRFMAHDQRGNHWVGWCEPSMETNGSTWVSKGALETLSVFARNAEITNADTEILYLADLSTEFGRYMRAFAGPSPYEFDACGTPIRFEYDTENQFLIVRFPIRTHPSIYLESWLGQTIRILFGQPIGPRLTVRNRGEGTAQIGVRQSNRYIPYARYASLFLWDDEPKTRESFWSLFSSVLNFISATDKYVELHPVTQFYDEISQASLGSRWVWALTLSSAIEGMTLQLQPERTRPLDAEHVSMIKYIENWEGPKPLRDNVINQLRSRNKITTSRILTDLQNDGRVQQAGVTAWNSMRNQVVHGTLIAPWSKEEEDEKIKALATLFHDLMRHLINA